MSEEKYKVCMNKECKKYNIVVKTKWHFCPFCQTRLTYPVVTKIQMKCKTCDTPIDKDTGTEEGYCLVCVEKTNQLLQLLDRIIPWD